MAPSPGIGLRAAFETAPQHALKAADYFNSYERLFSARLGGKSVNLVEIGVLHGGSLHMWRTYFGPNTRVVGVDRNPTAKLNEQDGFEIHIADQTNLGDLKRVLASCGPIDVLIDDGAHTNQATINTIVAGRETVSPGGVIVVEDLTTSFDSEFGNPSSSSAFEFCVRMAAALSRAGLSHGEHSLSTALQRVASVEFLPSMVAIHIRTNDDLWAGLGTVHNAAPLRPDVSDLRDSHLRGHGAVHRMSSVGSKLRLLQLPTQATIRVLERMRSPIRQAQHRQENLRFRKRLKAIEERLGIT